MSSHKSDGGRIPRLKDVASQSRIVSSPAMASARSFTSPAELSSRPQIPRPTNVFTKTTRASSMSSAEESRPSVAGSIPSRTPPGQHVRPPIPPPATTQPLPSKPLHMTSDRSAQEALHMAVEPLSAPEIAKQNPAPSRPRNVLRRKAPTIGQHTAKNKPPPERIRPEKLNVVIPDNPPIGHTAGSGFFQSHASETDLANKLATPMASQDNLSSIVQDHRAHTGPKELASLRTTTINTQNLPPPTPIIPSASSPSTRYSDSPGVWSRTSTPTTLSSYSPGIVHPVKVPRLRQASPSQSRLPVFSHQAQQASPASSRAASGTTKSPLLASSTSSRTSIVENEAVQPVSKPSMTSMANSYNSHLPRKASTSSVANSVRKENTNQDTSPKTERRTSGIWSHGFRDAAMMRGAIQIPSRPTREGTHQLVLEPSPVVQSNISPKAVTGHKRRGSGEKSPIVERLSGWNRSAATSVDSLHSHASSKSNITPRIPTSPDLSRKPPPSMLTNEAKPQQDATSPGKSRAFGLFTKRSKPDLDARSEGRSARKGPVAGTGHEGYGRYAQRGRKSSVSSNTSRARSTSTTRSGPKSVASSKGSTRGRPELDLDDFLLDRLEPVIIRGGDMDGMAFARRPSEQSTSGLSTASTSNLTVQSKVSVSPGCSTETLASSRVSADPAESIIKSLGRQEPLGKPEVASTRSEEKGPKGVKSPASHSIQGLHQANLDIRATRPRASDEVKNPQKQSRRGLGIKWNIFQRKQSADKTDTKISTPPAPKLHATVSRAVAQRPVAHYAMIDIDSDPLEEIVHNVENSPPTEDEDISSPVQVPPALNIKKPTESILLPSPPMLHDALFRDQPQSPKVYFDKSLVPQGPETEETKVEEERPSRLASVGRIPRVVSRRERPHKPAIQSFSRPFSVAQSPSVPAPVVDMPGDMSFSSIFTPETRYESPSQPADYKFDLTNPFKDPLKGSVLDFIAGPYSKEEFMSFFPRKDSLLSTSSGSDSLAAVTAVIPKPESELTEDEVWGEYDDLIDHVLSPQTTSTVFETESEADHKLELATMASRTLQAELNGRQDLSTLVKPAVEFTPSSPQSSTGSVRLRRSKIAPELHSSLTLSSQPSYSDIIASYGDDRSETSVMERDTGDKSLAPNPVVEQQSGLLSSTTLVSSPSFEIVRQRNTVLFDIAERDREGPTAFTNIRSGSLMTSRWLSFGRVLFSPAHNHAKGTDKERVLVVDGLGNDDWSFYCSLTYPNAEVYSLSDAPKPTASKHPEAWQPPSNHHTIHHPSLDDPLPFPRAFFAATVLRFPAACSERAQDNIVSECKRVLRAGGYMEMSILDLDMVNMGIRTRKAVRKLKERTYISDPNISLKPASDSIQRLLGRHGFDNLRRCMVRIPVAGMIVRTSASSTSTSSSDPSATTTSPSAPFSPLTGLSAAARAKAKAHGKSSSNDTDLSLGDLLSDPSPSPSNDESIRKIVAKVGRWWYTRCYEIPVLPNGDVALSIWSERKILRECQHRGTGFRLWIAYAQKPSEKRRTASV